MNCPGCNKILASSLSVCPSCGTMIGDSVREELALKISPLVKSAKAEIKKEMPSAPLMHTEAVASSAPSSPAAAAAPKTFERVTSPAAAAPITAATGERATVQKKPTLSGHPLQTPPADEMTTPVRSVETTSKPETAEINAKPTSPTLVDFRHKNAVVPEWRLHLQNAVRKRQDYREGGPAVEVVATAAVGTPIKQPQPTPTPMMPSMTLATNGATALQAEPDIRKNPVVAGNPKLEAALRRIEQSRQVYGAPEEKPKPHLTAVAPPPAVTHAPKTFPYAVTPQTAPPPAAATTEAAVYKEEKFAPKPAPRTFVIEKKAEKFDTNKLPPLAQVAKNFSPAAADDSPRFFRPADTKKRLDGDSLEETDSETPEVAAYAETGSLEAVAAAEVEEFEEIDDCAPVSLRFNAGLFDLIIGSFLSFVLLAPFMLLNGNLFTFQGLLAFLATCAIVMFIYLTVTVGFLGRTFGMRLFSLEIIDIEENEYPTFHQAAVNSCVYLFSLALGGIGFLPLFFNSEKRAAHDLLSGTIVVREEL